jgi:glycosyltransferase involved in cell wall biosynthesis
MLIGLNGQRLLLENPAGPEKYTFNIYRALSKIDTTNNYIIYFTHKPSKDYFEQLTNGNKNFSYVVVPKLLSWTQMGLAMELALRPVDVFFSPVHTMPVLHDSRTRFVGMIHGLEYKFSAEYTDPIKRQMLHRPEQYVCENSDRIIVPSFATRNEILNKQWKDVNENKICVIPEGVDETFYRRSKEEVANTLKKFMLPADLKYMIFISTIQPRKNIPNMVAGYSEAIKAHPELKDTKLLIVGKKGWMYEDSLEAPKKYGIENNVMFLGRVDDEELPALISGAQAFVNISFEEGFGLPLLESMACGVPAVVSDIPAFHEIGESIIRYVDPNDIESIKKGIFEELLDQRSPDIAALVSRAKLFTWENSAKQVLQVFEDVVKN